MTKVEKLKELQEKLKTQLSRAEFFQYFPEIMRVILEIEKNLINKINQAIESFKSEFEGLKKATQASLRDLQAKYDERLDKALFDQKNSLDFIRDKIRNLKNGKDGKDGKDADEDKIIDEVLARIKLPEQKEIILDDGLAIKNKLETLDEDDKLGIEAIAGLMDKLEELRQLKGRSGGGGFSAIAYNLHIVDDEELTGTKNAVNTDFTINNLPSPANSLKIFKNGQRLKLAEHYTVSSRTITFLEAPLADDTLTADYRV